MPAGSQCEKRTGTLRVKAPFGGTNRSWSMGQRPQASRRRGRRRCRADHMRNHGGFESAILVLYIWSHFLRKTGVHFSGKCSNVWTRSLRGSTFRRPRKGRSKPREERMLRTTLARSLKVIGLAALLAAPVASAQDSPPVRVRGTIERIDGAVYVVKARDGAELKLTLPDNPQIAGITAMPQADGSQSALEVHIFPESMRGTGEGHYPWDLRPQSTMTNANVEQTVTAMEGQTLTLKYKDGEKKIIVPADAVIVTYVPGDKAELKPGTKIIVAATKQEDGSLRTPRINYGKDGLTPPM